MLSIEGRIEEEDGGASYEDMDNKKVDQKLIDDGDLYVGTNKADCIEYEKILAF